MPKLPRRCVDFTTCTATTTERTNMNIPHLGDKHVRTRPARSGGRFVAFSLLVLFVGSECGAAGETWVIGQSTALTGPASAVGREVQAGLKICIAAENRRGAVAGKRLSLLSLDDR